ncbi:MAG: hypothetical protein IPL61_12970 [Myxococcales bacterium]|nr:hypothetical protein [Myxococcales bacterium]
MRSTLRPLLRPALIGAAALALSMIGCQFDDPPSPVDTSAAQARPLEAGVTVGVSRAMLSVNETLSPDAYAGLLTELRERGVHPLVGLPGNLIITEGLPAGFSPATLRVPTSVHRRGSDQRWYPAPATASDAHLQPQASVHDSPELEAIGADALAVMLERISVQPPRAQSVALAAAVLDDEWVTRPEADRPVEMEPAPPQETADQIALEREDAIRRAADGSQDADQEIAFADLRLATITSDPVSPDGHRAPLIQGAKSAHNTIAISVFFPESTGVGNEDWDAAALAHMKTMIALGFASVASVAPDHAHLYFHLQFIDDSRAWISHEPTSGVNESVWINELLGTMGTPFNFLGHQVRNQAFEEGVARGLGADHATSLFVVRDQRAPFEDVNSRTATAAPHAFFNGYLVINDNVRYQSHEDYYAIHEWLHTVNADDQVNRAGNLSWPCKHSGSVGHERVRRQGVPVDFTNANHDVCYNHASVQGSIMKGNDFVERLLGAYPFGPYGWTQRRPIIDWYSRAAIGWGNSAQLVAQVGSTPSAPGFPPQGFSPAPVFGIQGSNSAGPSPFPQNAVFRYIPTLEPIEITRPVCLAEAGAPQNLWVADGMQASVTCLALRTVTLPVQFWSDRSEVEITSITGNDEGQVHYASIDYAPAPQPPPDPACSAWPYWHDGYAHVAQTTALGCFARAIPEDRTPFTYGSSYFLTKEKYCDQGGFDGANCLLHYAPANTHGSFSISTNNHAYWYQPNNSVCAIGTYVQPIGFGGAICHVMSAPPGTSLFVWSGTLYSTPLKRCSPSEVDGGTHCYWGRHPAPRRPSSSAARSTTSPERPASARSYHRALQAIGTRGAPRPGPPCAS